MGKKEIEIELIERVSEIDQETRDKVKVKTQNFEIILKGDRIKIGMSAEPAYFCAVHCGHGRRIQKRIRGRIDDRREQIWDFGIHGRRSDNKEAKVLGNMIKRLETYLEKK